MGVMDADETDETLRAVGPRLRALRQERDTTLAELAAATGISVSTLSRLESGARRPSLELLLPLAKAHGVTLDELVDAPPTGDPRVDDDDPVDPAAGWSPGVQADPAGRQSPRAGAEDPRGIRVVVRAQRPAAGDPRRARSDPHPRRGDRVRHPAPALVRTGRGRSGRVPQPIRGAGGAGAPAGRSATNGGEGLIAAPTAAVTTTSARTAPAGRRRRTVADSGKDRPRPVRPRLPVPPAVRRVRPASAARCTRGPACGPRPPGRTRRPRPSGPRRAGRPA